MAKRNRQNIMPPVKNKLFLERPRVDGILEKALERHIITVVAGEGYGKTHAMHSFLQKDRRDVYWLQISERDNITWRYWENYAGEVAIHNPKAAKTIAALGFPESSAQFDRYLTFLRNEMAHDRYVIVLDDFHLITNPVVISFLTRAMSTPGSKSHIVLISRTESAINSMSFLARGLLSQITEEDLRFTEDETGEYFRLNNLPLEPEELARIYGDTEGWTMAIDLILQELKAAPPSKKGRNWDLALRPVRKIEESLFESMDPGLRKFLIKLSLIEHWPRDLLEQLDPAGNNITAMERFTSLVRFDTYLHGFRIHPLFLDFLREKQRQLSGAEIREVYGIAARWCMENNLFIDAAVDYERAGDCEGLIRVLYSLPPLLTMPVASFFMETLERLVPGPGEAGGQPDMIFLWYIVRPRLLMLLGRFEESAGEFRKGIACFESLPPGPQRSSSLAFACGGMGILNLLSCRYTKKYDFASWFERNYRHYLEDPEVAQGQYVQCNLPAYVFQVGDPAEPEEITAFIDDLSRAIPFAANSRNGFLYGLDNLSWAELAYYQGDLARAEQFARQAVFQSQGRRQYEVENRGLFYLMRICIHLGNFAEIRELQKKLEAQLEIADYFNRYIIHDITMARFYARIGLVEKVSPWLRGAPEEENMNGLFRGFHALINARCFSFEKNYPAVLHIIEEEEKRNDLGSFLLGKLEMSVLRAAAYAHLGKEDEALQMLERAYALAAPISLYMPFIELGEDMRLLAGAVLARQPDPPESAAGLPGGEIPRSWLENVRSRASAYSKQITLAVEYYQRRGEEKKPPVYLNRQERRILAGLSRGLTRQDIAGEAGLSVNAVKVNISAIYQKLGAVNRADAIRIAGSLGIL
jgi:LuxR family maltose regulon positive regulatory protein